MTAQNKAAPHPIAADDISGLTQKMTAQNRVGSLKVLGYA